MPKVLTIGEMLVEIMRKDVGTSLGEAAEFVGPYPSGAPAIFIDAVARLGMSAGIIGAIGDDEFGECILKRLGDDGVDTSRVKKVGDRSTGVAFVAYFHDGSRKFIFHVNDSAAGAIGTVDVQEEYVRSASSIHVSGSSLAMGEGMRKACYKMMNVAKEAGALISFDPNVRMELLGISEMRQVFAPVLKSADLLIPTSEELQQISGIGDEKEAVEEMLRKGIDVVAVKRGKEGCRIYTEAEIVEARAFDVKAIDPTGAGDAFSAAIVVGWLEEMSLRKLAVFANAVGGRATTVKGPMEGLAWREEIDMLTKRKIPSQE